MSYKIPTIKVTDGKQTIIVNVSDQDEWKARGFLPEKAVPDNKTNPSPDQKLLLTKRRHSRRVSGAQVY